MTISQVQRRWELTVTYATERAIKDNQKWGIRGFLTQEGTWSYECYRKNLVYKPGHRHKCRIFKDRQLGVWRVVCYSAIADNRKFFDWSNALNSALFHYNIYDS